jgi:hypothetical protein
MFHLGPIAGGPGKTAGTTIGRAAAETVLARAGSGWARQIVLCRLLTLRPNRRRLPTVMQI